MLQGKIEGQKAHPIPRWSDCDCKPCTSWTTSGKETLFVKAEGAKDKAKEDVLFIHGFISSSAFWTETVFPNLSDAEIQLPIFAVDLLGTTFAWPVGPSEFLMTKTSIYLLLPPLDINANFRKHVHRIRTFLLEGFFSHTHNAAWHTLHNIICGTASKLDGYLDTVRDHLKCDVNIFHGSNDELIPVECSYNVQERVPRASVNVIEKKDHITIVVGRQKAFTRELEEIWSRSSS
ncbi:hypothetical protein GH714_011449 [Hevea brasiliensis]|uniref:AB hydrolase-1 domain-containing protein n=1 Tax=Hevea brasiliensis TaxID=3981 RepID=A0A6A6MLY2_HEVBR|nr:hypothetical protein GH714_011449 [Hevea brasiliensis]